MKALAIICTFNEADIIPWTVRHLKRQGCDVLVIDCQSTDGTAELAAREGAHIRMVWTPPVAWHVLLGLVESFAKVAIGEYDWCVHCDADELRYSDGAKLVEITTQDDTWRRYTEIQETLLDGFARVQAAGYNAIDHQVITFHPTMEDGVLLTGSAKVRVRRGEGSFYDGTQDPEDYFRYFGLDDLNQRCGQVKAWRNTRPVSLAASAGHRVWFEGIKVYPGMFLSKHYPIRSQAHGERKVFHERVWKDQSEGRTDWHVQYDGIKPGHSFLKDPATLKEWR